MDIDNEILVSSSKDFKVQVWSLETNRKLFEVAHESNVHCVKVVDKMVISCGDKAVRIWSLEDGKLLHKLHLPDRCRNFDLNSEKSLLAVAHDQGVSLWDFSNVVQVMEIELYYVSDVRFNEHGTTLIVGQKQGQVSKIDLY